MLDSIFKVFVDYQNWIIGIGLPIILFGIQLLLWMKDHRICDISLIENRNIILDPSLSNRVDGLFVSYQGEPIKNWLLYYQVTITNSGAKDISRNEVVIPLTLSMPDNVKIISCKVYDKSEPLELDISSNKNQIIIKWDLLKKNEYVRLDIVADYDSSYGEYKYNKHSLLSKISYRNSRIQDLSVRKTNIRSYELFLRNIKTVVYYLIATIFLFSIFNRYETINEYNIITNDGNSLSGQLVFSQDSVLVVGTGEVGYPLVITATQERKIEKTHSLPKNFLLILINIWGFILLEQWRMRRKRVRYGLVSNKPWNQFDIEDC